jgi:hypothetical protein
MDENDQVDVLDTETVDDVTDESQESLDDQLDDEALPEEDDSEELEHDGQKYKLPKALKPLLMMQADYTQKTQALAEQRKALEVEASQQQARINQNLQEVAQIVNIDQQLQQLQNVNWQQLSDNDPLQAQQLWFKFQQLKDARGQIVSTISQREQQLKEQAQQAQAQALQQGNEQLAKDIPGWGAEKAKQILDFAQAELGYSMHELQNITDPRIVKTLHAAMIGQQVLKKQAKPKVDAKPVKTVGKGSPATKDPSRMSTEEWMRSRSEQIRKQKRR